MRRLDSEQPARFNSLRASYASQPALRCGAVHCATLAGSSTGLPNAGVDRQYTPSWVDSQIRLRSHSMKTFSEVPRRQVAKSSILPSRGGTENATCFGCVGL